MKIRITTIFLAFLLIFSQMILSPKEVSAAQSTVKLSSVKGEVIIKTGGGLREFPAVDGTELIQGDWLRTGKNGTAKLTYEDGTEATIGASSLLNIQRLSTSDTVSVSARHRVRITSWRDGHKSSIELWAGSIWNKVKSLLNIDDEYEVETPTAVMGVRGTLYLVSVDQENGSTQSDVIDGAVGVTQNKEDTQAAPIQVVTMGQTLKLVSLTAPLPDNQVISQQELIKNTQPEILGQVIRDIIERTKELADITKEQQLAFGQTGNIKDLTSAIGTSFKLDELASFGKEFMDNLQKSDKLEEIKQVLKDNNQSIEQLQTTIDNLKTETEQIRSEVLETAKKAGVSQEQIDGIGQEASGVPPTSASEPTTPTQPPSEGGGGGSDNSSTTTVTSTEYTVSAGTITNVPYGTSKATFLSKVAKGESHQSWDTTGMNDPVASNDKIVVTAQNGTQATYTITVVAALKSIAITTPTTKLAYTVGDKLDLSGLVVTGTYSDNSTKEEPVTEANVTGFDSSAPVTSQTLTITIGGKTATYTVAITVNAPVVVTPPADVIPPTLSGVTAGPVTMGGNVEATSNEDGLLYLVPLATVANKVDIDTAGTAANGVKVAAKANVSANLSTEGFATGTYKVYAIDVAGNVSTASAVITVSALNRTVSDFVYKTKSDTTATFNWTPAVGATEIKIETALTGNTTWTDATTGTIAVDAATATVTGLTASTGYDFRLVVTGGINAGNSNTLVNVVTDAVSTADISGSFTDINFKQAVWEWLGNGGTPGVFTQQDLNNRMASKYNLLDIYGRNISSLAGLENFQGTGLTGLNCGDNELSSLPTLPTSLTLLECSNNYLNTFEGALKIALDNCSAVNKYFTPQYRYSFTGAPITLGTAATHTLTGTELSRQQSSDGTNWSNVADGVISKFTFTSSDDAVATVDSLGIITAHAQGSCVIYAKYGNVDSDFTTVIILVESCVINSENIDVINNVGAEDLVTVSGLVAGDIVKVYDAATNGNLLGTSEPVVEGQNSTTVSNLDLGDNAGSVWVTVTSTGKSEGSRIQKDFEGIALELSVAVTPITVNGSAKVTVTGPASHHFEVNITSEQVSTPNIRDLVQLTGDNVVNPFTSGQDIIYGIAAMKFLQVYDVDAEGKIVKFFQTRLQATNFSDLYYQCVTSNDQGDLGNSYEDIKSTGNYYNHTDDDSKRVPLDFNFNFYGRNYSEVFVGTNGYLTFGGGDATFVNYSFPNINNGYDSLLKLPRIAPFFDDLIVRKPNSGVYCLTEGTAPNRRFIVQWREEDHFYNSPNTVDFEAIL